MAELVKLNRRFSRKFAPSFHCHFDYPRDSENRIEIVSSDRIINRILLSFATSVTSPNRFLSATGARTIATDDYRISVSLALPHRVLHLHPFRATFHLSCDDLLPTTPSIFVVVTT